MRDLSFFLFKNYLGAKMRKRFKHFCNGDGSTSTVSQQHQSMMMMGQPQSASVYSPYLGGDGERQPTLEEMILQLEVEEAASRRAKLDEEYGEIRHRMSCVNSSDILRSARSALNQYPRFSLDGKDSMYRSSFRNMSPVGGRNSPAGYYQQGSSRGFYAKGSGSELEKLRGMPAMVAGERVVWCSPGVVPKLMGLEAMPIPVQGYRRRRDNQLLGLNARQNLRRTAGRLYQDDVENMRSALELNGYGGGLKRNEASGSCSTSRQGYYHMKPLRMGMELGDDDEQLGLQMRRFRQKDTSRY